MNVSALPPLTAVESLAVEATKLPSFAINLEEVRRTVAHLLQEFGRYGFFDEYTTHNFEHIYGLLKVLDWLIPSDTRHQLTKGDWWMLTMACYFHDLGLVVTRDEFENRKDSQFKEFCETVLFSGPDAADYREKVHQLGSDQAEKFFYQEFVRHNHASRVRAWISGTRRCSLGKAEAVASELDRLLKPLSSAVRNDLALVCESHNLKIIDDDSRYPIFRPFGTSEDETVNLQYAAIMLRTADLIQITNKRAPTVLFKIINPKDPTSQTEWLKQNAVTHIRPLPKEDRSGEVTRSVQPDTIQVFADFKESEGFFGLTAYLKYAQDELQQSYAVAEKSKKRSDKKLSFPWRYIDDSQVKAEGFEPKQYGFEIDQKKVLDLLTGHTLYNDSAVVLRELAQNALDAVRLQSSEDGTSAEKVGNVFIRWDSKKAELEISDNGTGMTQEIIENHLLKVGSSRYQDDKFIESHPTFSPISRFGIGVLSAFMIADEVEFITCSSSDEFARQISLRSVHGKYLIRLLKKDDDAVSRIAPHGTSVRLKLRPSAKRIDVLKTTRQWVVVPGCTVEVQIDSDPRMKIGFASPKEALENYLTQSRSRALGLKYRVEEKAVDGLRIAYALEHNNFYDEWTFVSAPADRITLDGVPIVAICVEGITVVPVSPGFDRGGILAIGNATGRGAPKTNVARSLLEETDERTQVIEKTYAIYLSQLKDEIRRMIEREKHPLSRVINQLPYIADDLDWQRSDESAAARYKVSHPQLLRKSFSDLPIFLLEDSHGRAAASLTDLTARGGFWTVESALTTSVEDLISHMPVDVTARNVLGFAKSRVPELPEGALISNLNSRLAKASIQGVFEIVRIRAIEDGHRLDIEWGPASGRWVSSEDVQARLRRMNYRRAAELVDAFQGRQVRTRAGSVFSPSSEFKFPIGEIRAEGLANYGAVVALGVLHFLPASKCVEKFSAGLVSEDFEVVATAYVSLQVAMQILRRSQKSNAHVEEFLDKTKKGLVPKGLDGYLSDMELKGLYSEGTWNTFNPFAWSRNAGASPDLYY